MKHTTIILVAAIIAASCTGKLPDTTYEGSATITVSARPDGEVSSRATGINDDAISKLRIEVYNADGTMDTAGTFTENQSPTLTVGCGKHKLIKVYANFKKDEPSEEVFLDSALDGRLAMTGQTVCDISGDTGISVHLRRLVAKITVKGIMNHTAHDITIESVYLTNAVSAIDGGIETGWSNRMGFESSGYDRFLYSHSGSVLPSGSDAEDIFTFYAFPNGTDADFHKATWCPRKTRVVLQAVMMGHRYYYTITMSHIAANTEYTIRSVDITRPGSSSPETSTDVNDAGAIITWRHWNDTENERTI
jgi:hypothetical protein